MFKKHIHIYIYINEHLESKIYMSIYMIILSRVEIEGVIFVSGRLDIWTYGHTDI